MSKQILKYKFLLLFLLAFVAGMIIDIYSSNNENLRIDPKSIEKILHQKEDYQRKLADSLAGFLDSNDVDISGFVFFDISRLDSLKKSGFTVLVYKHDSLVYWTDNIFNVPYVYDSDLFDVGCNKIGNTWADIYIKQTPDKTYKVISLLRIKEEYEIHNKFLHDKFLDDFRLPENVSISLIPISYGIDIKDIDGNYLLSLIPTNSVIADGKTPVIISILYILGIVFLVLFLHDWFLWIPDKHHNLKTLLLIVSIIIFRILMIIYKFPKNFYTQDLFSEQLIYSPFSYSLGDWLFDLLLLSLIVYHSIKLLSNVITDNTKTGIKIFWTSLLLVLSFGTFVYAFMFIKKFIISSPINVELFNIQYFNRFSYFAVLDIVLTAGFSIFFMYYVIDFAKKTSVKLIFIYGSILLIGPIVPMLFDNIPDWYVVLGLIVFYVVIVLFVNKKKANSLTFFAVMAVLGALLTSSVIIDSLIQKQNQDNLVQIVKLADKRDDVAELMLKEISPKLDKDVNIPDIITKKYSENQVISSLESYLNRNYLKSYWNKYDLNIIYCFTDDYKKNQCKFDELEDKGLEKDWIIDRTYFVMQPDGQTFYLIEKKYPVKRNDSVNVYFIFRPRLYPGNIGYPQLLLDQSVKLEKNHSFSYAKYQNGKLVYKSGSYNYPLKADKFIDKNDSIGYIDEGKIRHIVYNISPSVFMVMSYNRINFANSVILYAYIFLTFIALIILILLLNNLKSLKKIGNLSFRAKIILSSLAALTFSFLIIGIITVLFNISQYKKQQIEKMNKTLEEINISISQKISENPDTLQIQMRQLADIFDVDINLYSNNGFLISTSRPEIYKLNIIAPRINSKSFYKIKKNSLVDFIQKENISRLAYNSGYSLILDNHQIPEAIVNVPFFTDPEVLKSDILNIIVSIINIYVVLFVIAIVLSILISEQIISPLITLQDKFKKIKIGENYEKIDYRRKDEIGSLVEEYNKMVDKLKESIEKLQKSERENAWRDMAKQIAHEIKNPLTPMKLSIQLLLRSWENQDPDFDERLKNTTETLITQIETLKRIAEEFSEFAKMPKPQEQVINVANKIEEICKLYENSDVDVIPDLQHYKEPLIIADEKQITRALINLVKNAIQAIPQGVRGKIILRLEIYGGKVVIKVIDNGSGIPEEVRDKLFIPSFTTKSSGMGLGLAMVKNIVDNAGGKISFTTEVGKGTTFILEFPLYVPEEKDEQ